MRFSYISRLLYIYSLAVFFFKQKTAYEMRISDWSSDVCSSDLAHLLSCRAPPRRIELMRAEARERMIEPLERGAHERRDIRGESPAILGPNRAVEIVIHDK